MVKFIKTKDDENKFDVTNVTVEIPFNEISLEEMLTSFEEFLRACGFNFDGSLDIVEND